MKSIQSIVGWLALAVSSVFIVAVPARGQEKLQQQDPQVDAAVKEIQAAQKELLPLIAGKDIYGDEAVRAELGPKILPPLRRMLGAADTIAAHAAGGVKNSNMDVVAMLAYFGDADAAARLKKDAQSSDETQAVSAQGGLALQDWWTCAHDAPGQKRVLERVETLAKAHSDSDAIAGMVNLMRGTAASDELRDATVKIITDDLKSPLAQAMAMQANAERKLKEMVGKPLVVSGLTADGSRFTTADWKGKVVMVDFWATWCRPCMAELPNVKKAYGDYHAKGLEIVGVSCDNGAGPLKQFLEKNRDMPWPQLFNPAKPGWHEIATNLGVQGIPTMFLIDRGGILRTTEARGNLDKEITRLLEEKPPAE